MANIYSKLKKAVLVTMMALFLLSMPVLGANNKYQGTDDLIEKKMQGVAGVGAKAPLINVDQGDLGLFVFAVGGFAAGTIVGYNWRKIFGGKQVIK